MHADKLPLETILNKIYFEAYTYDDIKEYLFPALRNIRGVNQFFEALFSTLRSYSEVIYIVCFISSSSSSYKWFYCLKEVKKLMKESLIEILAKNEASLREDYDGEQTIRFKRFNKCSA